MPPEEEAKPAESLDIEAAVGDIANALKLAPEPEEAATVDGETQTAEPAEDAPAAESGSEGAEAAPAEGKGDESPAVPAAPAADAPPDTWTKEAKAKWATVDPELQAEIRRREGDIAKLAGEAGKAVEQSKNKVAVADQLERVMEPFAGVYQKYGINPWTHLQNLLNSHYQLVFGDPETKLQMVRKIAADAGLDLANLPAAGAAQENPLAGTVRALQQELAQLRGGVTSVTSAIQESRAAELEAGILAFMNDTKAHPYFVEVAADIAPLIESGAARSLQEAYDLAVYRNPATRSKLLTAEANANATAKAKADAEKAAAARKATGANVVSRRAGKGAPPKETVEDTIRNTLSDIRSRTH